jgi:hypothetical protein
VAVSSNFKMAPSSKYFFWTTLLTMWCCTTSGQLQTQKASEEQKRIIKVSGIDTSRYAIFPFIQSKNYFFDSTYVPAALTKTDLNKIEVILNKFVDSYNKDISGDSNSQYYIIDFKRMKYKRQYIAVVNHDGEKEVWINFLCMTHNDNWKKELIFANDGGSCFFHLKINLTKEICYDLFVNGLA